MKTKSKALLLSLCAALLVVGSVMGTLAYLTVTASVTNTFTVGKVTFNDEDFAGGLDEVKTDMYGVADEEGTRVQANEYKLVPGHEYTKDPTVHIGDDSEDCYLFVKVENGIASLEATGATTIEAQMLAKGWKKLENVDNVWYYCGLTEGEVNTNIAVVKASDNVVVFENFTLADDADLSILNKDNDGNVTDKIVVNAYAIQADGFAEKTPGEIWAAGNWT